ncbi:MAG: Rrf2 family transcriptional regulator [Burkholderiaceae bacterium]|jgi:Rrf2 family protein|nr:Rrf2 family transcriptional regulator [Burkholderiaceae bacterium]
MKFSTKSRYALRMMLDLTIHNTSDYISIKDISRRQDISAKYLEQIVPQLNRAGLLNSTRGAQGGYRLARRPSEITAGDVLRATEGNLAPINCLKGGIDTCPNEMLCMTQEFWAGLYSTMNTYLDGLTLENIAESYRARMPLNFSI